MSRPGSRARTMMLVAALAVAPALLAEPEFEVGLESDDNINLAPGSIHEYSDRILSAGVAVDGRHQFDTALALAWDVNLTGTLWDEWTDLNSVRFGGTVGLRYKPGLGRDAIRYRLDLGLERRQIGDAARTGTAMRLDLGASQPLGGLWDLSYGYAFDSYFAAAEVHDHDRHQLYVSGTRYVGDAWSLTGSFDYLDGDFTSVTMGFGPGYDYSQADDVFMGSTAYRYTGSGYRLGFSADYASGETDLWTFYLSVDDVEADYGQSYGRMRFGVSYLRGF